MWGDYPLPPGPSGNTSRPSSQRLKLDRHVTRVQRSCGLYETRILIEWLIQSSVQRGRLARLQLISVIIICLHCGTRPSALAAGCQDDINELKYLTCGCIRIVSRGPCKWDVEINLKNHKGYNSTVTGRSLVFWLRELELVKNVLYGPWWIVIYLWARGVLGHYPTFNDLLVTRDAELIITRPDEPFLLSCVTGGTRLESNKPMLSKRISDNMKHASTKAGLGDLTAYDFRRDLANDLDIKAGKDKASLAMTHQDKVTPILTRHYSRGAGNFDMTGLRTGEASHLFLNGAQSALMMRLYTGTAVCSVSRPLALCAQIASEGDEHDSGGNVVTVDEALKVMEKEKEAFISKIQEEDETNDQDLYNYTVGLDRQWGLYFDALEKGSPLHTAVHKWKRNIGIFKRILVHDKYLKAPSSVREKAEGVAKNVTTANTTHQKRQQYVRKTAKIKAERLWEEKRKSIRDTVDDREKAVEYLEQTSPLITKAAKNSALSDKTLASHPEPNSASTSAQEVPPQEMIDGTTGETTDETTGETTVGETSVGETTANKPMSAEDRILAINLADDSEPVEEIVASHKEALGYKPNSKLGEETRASIKKLLVDDENKDTEGENGKDTAETTVEANAQPQEPVTEWDDKDETEEIHDAPAVDVRAELIKIALDPILYARECEEQRKADGGKSFCRKCRALDPEAELHDYSGPGSLRRHERHHHTDWSDLVLQMECGSKYMCPGACGSRKKFRSVDEVRDHCLSDECKDQQAFIVMKSNHDDIQQERFEEQNKYEDREDTARERNKTQARHIQYFASLEEADLLALAKEYDIPRERVEPHLELMLKNLKFVAENLS